MITIAPHNRKQAAKPALLQASNMRTNHKHFLPCPKQPSQRRCSIPQQTRACFSASWCRRQPARVKTKAVSPTRASPTPPIISPMKSKHLKASLVRCRCFPSTTPRRCWTAHKNAPANRASASMTPPQHLPQSTSLKRNPQFHKHTTKSQTCRKPAQSQASNTRTNNLIQLLSNATPHHHILIRN